MLRVQFPPVALMFHPIYEDQMKEELEKALYEKYPKLFANTGKSSMESCMAWGCECGDGWYDLISDLCWMIEQHERNVVGQTQWKKKENPEYESDYHPVKFDQIKEKYGGLRAYFSGGDDYVSGLVRMAEAYSYKTCENCGNKGKPNKGGWITTLCDQCRKT